MRIAIPTKIVTMSLMVTMAVSSPAVAAPNTADNAPPANRTQDTSGPQRPPVAENHDSTEHRTTIKLYVSARLGQSDEAVEAAVRTRLTHAAQSAGFVVVDNKTRSPRSLYVVVERDPLNHGSYIVKLAHRSVGTPKLHEHEPFGCDSCNGDKLLEKIARATEPVLERLKAPPKPARRQDPVPMTAAPEPAPPPPQRAKKLGLLGWGGLALLLAGTGTAVAGAVFVGKGKVVEFESNNDPFVNSVDYRRPGIVMLAVGAGAALAGGAMLVTDRIRSKSSKREVAMAPTLGAGMAGIALAGRF